MKIEYEAIFTGIDKNNVRAKLKKLKAKLVRKEFLEKTITFNLPKHVNIYNGWLRIRDHGDKLTMSLKAAQGNKITDQKEICLEINDIKSAEALLIALGCEKVAYHEKKREIWQLDKTEVCIDTRPFLEPYIEIEGKNENDVRNTVKKLGLDYKKARFCSADTLYSEKYLLTEHEVCNDIPLIVFNMENPFLKKTR